jgi:hypothetical protein
VGVAAHRPAASLWDIWDKWVLWDKSPVRVVCALTLAAVKRLHVVIPDDLHARLKGRASLRGKTIQDYVEETLRAQVERDEAEDRKAGRGR